jgi:hypothetical protein
MARPLQGNEAGGWAGNLDKWHDLCKSLVEVEKFLSRIAFRPLPWTCGQPQAEMPVYPPLGFADDILNCSGS